MATWQTALFPLHHAIALTSALLSAEHMPDLQQLDALQVSAAEFKATLPDPVASMSGPIAGHMNDDHAESVLSITRHYVPLDTDISAARMLTIDRLGMEVECTSPEGLFTCRVPYIRCASAGIDGISILDDLAHGKLTQMLAMRSAGQTLSAVLMSPQLCSTATAAYNWIS